MKIRRVSLLWLAYFLLAIMLTWPTITNLATHLPGDGGDDPAIAWNLWWVKQALLAEGQNPFHTDFMFFPIEVNLAFYTLTVLNAVTALPLTLNLGVVTASNLHMLFTFIVGGYGTFLLTLYLLNTVKIRPTAKQPSIAWLSAVIAGGFYAFGSSKLFYIALGQFNIGSSHWVPFAVLYIVRSRHNPYRLRNPLLAALFLTFQAWSEMTYASFLLIFIGLYWFDLIANCLIRRLQKPRFSPGLTLQPMLAHLRAAVVLSLTFALGLSPILAQMVPDLRAEGDFLIEGGGFAKAFSADLLGFLIPTMHHPFLGNLVRQTDISAFDKGQHVYVGFVLLGLTLFNLRHLYRHPALRFWLIATIVFALLCLGPVITIDGHETGIGGPFNVLQQLPFFKGNRYPSRYSVMLMLCLSVLAGFGLVQLGRWFEPAGKPLRSSTNSRTLSVNTSGLQNSPTHSMGINSAVDDYWAPMRNVRLVIVLTVIALLYLFEHLSFPLPQSDMRVPPPYQQLIAADPQPVTVLDIPFAWRNGFRITGALTPAFMFGQFYQTVHQKKLVQGNTSRNPEFKFQYFTNAPILNSLLALETGKMLPSERWETDRTIAPEVLRFFNIKYIVVRPYQYGWFNGKETVMVTEQAAIPYIEKILPVEKIHDEAELKIYRVIDNVDQACYSDACGLKSSLRVDSEAPLASLYFGEGWSLLSKGQPVAAQRKKVRLLLPLTGAAQQLTLRVRLPAGYQGPVQSVSLALNGWQSLPQIITREWQTLSFNLPDNAARPGLDPVYLHFAEVMPVEHRLTPAADLPERNVTVLSAGEDVGDFGHIFVNGRDISPNQRGYNIALIRPDGGIFAVANFDTHLDPSASAGLAEFIETAPADALVAVAAADDASMNLSGEAVQALQAIGATGEFGGCFRCSHAIISQAGTVVEALDPLGPVGVTTGLGLTEPNVAAIVEWIQVEAARE